MHFRKTIIGIVSVSMILWMLSSALNAGVNSSGLPKTDEILYKAYPGATPDVIVDEFLTKVTDRIGGPGRKDLYDKVLAAGHKVSDMNPMAEFQAIWLNDRNFKETSGEVNFPLNDSSFRLALSYIYGVDRKQADVFSYVQAPWTFAIGNPVPPAMATWYDETIQMPNTDWDTAWNILQTAGYSVNPSDKCVYRGAVKLRDLKITYSTGSLFWERGAGVGFVRAFNEFITTKLGAVGPKMSLSPAAFGTLVTDLLVTHNFDGICIGLTNLGRYADFLYDLLNSANIGPWAWNVFGISDPRFDSYTNIILTSLSVEEIQAAASAVQSIFVNELMPYFPISAGKAFCTVAKGDERGEIMNLISMPSYGPLNDWTWMTSHWKGTPGVAWPGGTIKQALAAELHTMNPYNEDTLYGWYMLDRAIPGLLMIDPTTLLDMPYIATNWSLASWTSIPEIGIVNGSTATFYLRQDVYWQDGQLVTAYDCVNNMRLLRKYRPGRYSTTWSNLVYEEADGPYKFNVYFFTPSLLWLPSIAGTALLSPKHITDLAEAKFGSILTGWDPAFTNYKDLTGVDPPAKYSFMKQIVGCGPFVFDYFDKSVQRGRMVKYDEFFVSAPVIGSVVGDWRIEPGATYTYRVLVQNIAAKNDSESGELVPVTVDVKVYEEDVLRHSETGITLDPWEWQYLGPYTTGALSGGNHTLKVEVYEGGNLIHTYVHKLVATLRADVTTYSGDKLDFKIDIADVYRAAKAFGSTAKDAADFTPAGRRWEPAADLNDDFKVNIKDMYEIAKKFGWHI